MQGYNTYKCIYYLTVPQGALSNTSQADHAQHPLLKCIVFSHFLENGKKIS